MSTKNDQARVSSTFSCQCSLALLLSLAALLMLPGCRSANGVQVDVMERELRQQENYIYELEDYLVEYSDKLRKCRCAHQSTIVKSNSVQSKSSSSSVPTLAEDDFSDDDLNFSDEPEETISSTSEKPRSADTPDADLPVPTTEDEPPVAEETPIEEVPLEEMQIPELEIEEPSAFKQNASPLVVTTAAADIIPVHDSPLYIPDPVNFQPDSYRSHESVALQNAILENEAPDNAFAEDALAVDEPEDDTLEADALDSDALDIGTIEVDHIVIQHLFRGLPLDEPTNGEATSRIDSQQELSFEKALFAEPSPRKTSLSSLLAVVEIRDQTNEPVEADGPVSLMVMAFGNDKKARRIQRWDFTEQEVAAAWQSSQYGDGLHLELPLDSQSLPDELLELWARLVSADSQKYLTKLPFEPQELLAFGDEPIPDTRMAETLVTAHTNNREADQFDPTMDEADSSLQQPPDRISQWRSSRAFPPRSRTNTASSTVKSTRWSAQPSGGRSGPPSPAVPTPHGPRPQPQSAERDFQTTPANTSSVWKTIQPGR